MPSEKANFNLNSDISMVATLGWNLNDRRLTSTGTELLKLLSKRAQGNGGLEYFC